MRIVGKATASRKASKRKGTQREHDVRKRLIGEGYVVYRGAASLGAADLIALKAGERPQLLQVKANVNGGAYMNFRKPERDTLREEAKRAGAYAMLIWWPHTKNAVEQCFDEAVWPA